MSTPSVLYVSPCGNDAWSGTIPDPAADGTNGPFATIGRARDAVRDLDRAELSCPVRVLVRGGHYELPETLVFLPEDSGTDACPITYAAYPGEQPVVSGGHLITGWLPTTVNGQVAWVTTLPEVAAGLWYFKQLFVNDTRRNRVRLPKAGFYRFTDLPDGRHAFAWYATTQRANFAPGEVCAWNHLSDVEIIALQHWFENHMHLAEVDESAQLVTFTTKAISDMNDEAGHCARYYVENVFEGMTEPGEWYLNRTTGQLFYIPMPGETPESVKVVAPRLTFLVQFLGSTDTGAKVRHIRLENLAFAHAEWNLPPENPGAVQAAFNVPGAIHLRGAEHCALYGCQIAHVGQYALEFMKGCFDNRAVACTMFDLGAGGVKIGHENWEGAFDQFEAGMAGLDPVALGWFAPDDAEMLAGRDNTRGMYTTIADCHVHNGGKIYHSAVGIWVGNSGYNRICHNSIHDLYYSAISVGWNWHYAPTNTIGNRIEYNHIYNIGRGLLSDMGAIYTLGLQTGSVLRGNLIHDVSCYGYGGSGIYPDQGSSYFTIEDNIVYHTQTDALGMHYGRDLTVRNNIFALGQAALVGRGREESVRPLRFERNIVYSANALPIGAGLGNGAVVMQENLYWREGGLPLTFGGHSWDEWRALGVDGDSLIADPLFADPHGGDFTLRSDSPAFALGIRGVNARMAGPRYQEGIRPASLADLPDDTLVDEAILEPRLEMGPPTFPTVRDAQRLTYQPATLALVPGEATTWSLTLVNRGKVAASGAVNVRITPEGAATVEGPSEVTFDLQPGGQMAASFTVILQPGVPICCIEAWSTHPGMPSTAQYLWPKHDDLLLPRLAAAASPAAAREALAAVPAEVLYAQGEDVARLRLAVLGDQLAISAEVVDQSIAVNTAQPWIGAGLEFFLGPHNGPITQVFLVPNTEHPEASVQTISKTENKVRGIEGARSAVQLESAGYHIVALIPLTCLGIPADADAFSGEVFVNTVLRPGSPRQQVKLFGAVNTWMGLEGQGTFRMKG